MRNMSNRFVLIFLCVMCSLICISCGKTPAASADIRSAVLQQLDNITSYEMNVVYAESMKDEESNVAVQNNCKTMIKFDKPDRLYIQAVADISTRSADEKQDAALKMYTTFDGKHQKARYSAESNGEASTTSIVLDMSINPVETPFNGLNIKGCGLLEGKDYIGSIRTLVNQYDFQKLDQKGDITTLTGTFNIERLADMLSKRMLKEHAQRLAESLAQDQDAFVIRVDTTRNLVFGFTFRNDDVTRKCRFENIRINQEIDPDVFVFNALPDEEFTDITDDLRENRGLVEEMR